MRDVWKTYSNGETAVHALRGVGFSVERGEFVAIMGASGSGKSTMMNILGCLDQPTQGEYWLDGKLVGGLERDELAEIRGSKIGFVFQQFNLLPRTPAVEQVQLPLLYNGHHSDREMREKALSLLEAVGLKGREGHHPSQLSGGQQQRVAIARALVNDPAILLADEPTGALDSRTSVEIMAIFQRLNREQGITVVLVTHEHDIAAYAKRILHFKDGLILTDEINQVPTNAAEEVARLTQEVAA
jgi:putative ABC transport system ATP-binding protein